MARDFVAIYRRRQALARAQGYESYGQKRRILRQLPDLVSEGNRLACGPDQDPPTQPREGSRMCTALNARVNPRDRDRSGAWQHRLWVAVEQMRRENKRERRAA